MAEAESFAEWVRRARKALDLSQRELALQVGCAVVTIQKIEESRRRPSRETAGLLCDRLEIAPDDRARF
jgi:transcriptional regulator with XRE-family HTH domain